MTTTSTATISYNARTGTTSISQSPNPVTLDYGNSIAMRVGSGFPSDSVISQFTVFTNTVVNGRDTKGTVIGTWTRGNTAQPDPKLSVSVSGSDILVEDVDTDVDEKVWYSLTVSHGVDKWSADPEMIVKAKIRN